MRLMHPTRPHTGHVESSRPMHGPWRCTKPLLELGAFAVAATLMAAPLPAKASTGAIIRPDTSARIAAVQEKKTDGQKTGSPDLIYAGIGSICLALIGLALQTGLDNHNCRYRMEHPEESEQQFRW